MRNVFFVLISLFGIMTLTAQDEREKVLATVQKSSIEGHIYFLADDLLKGRETGTAENKIAATYLANTLRSYGVKPNPASGNYFQEVKLERKYPPESLSFSIGGSTIENIAALKAYNMDYSAGFVFAGYGLEEDYEGIDVSGKVVLVKAGSSESETAQQAYNLIYKKRNLAQEKGAAAIIEFIKAQDQMWSYIDHQFNAPSLSISNEEEDSSGLTYLWVQDVGGTLAGKFSAEPNHSGALKIVQPEGEDLVSYNVVGMVEGTDPELKDEFIIYSAHYDHVGVGSPDETGDTIYNGARDNAVGTTTVLSMAQNLAAYPTKRSALFILFTGEEKGLLGSQYYVENPVLPLKDMVYCFNSDNGGYNDTSLATIIGLTRTSAGPHIKEAASSFGLTAIEDPAPEQGLFDRSDNVNFAKKGIPAPTFSLGFTAFNGEVTKYYHRPGDEPDTMDYDYLEKFFRAYVLAGRLIANDPQTPSWTPGDKYEAAAKALYNE